MQNLTKVTLEKFFQSTDQNESFCIFEVLVLIPSLLNNKILKESKLTPLGSNLNA